MKNETIKNITDEKPAMSVTCYDCGYVGDKAKWIGTITIHGEVKEMSGMVTLDGEDYDCSVLMEDVDDYDGFDGEACCSICGSKEIY